MAISKVILNGETLMDVTQDTVASDSLLTGKTATKNDGTKVTGNYAVKLEPLIVKSTEEARVFDGSPQTTEINGAILESDEMDSGKDSNTLTSSLVWRDGTNDTSIVIGQKYHLSGWFGTGDTAETRQTILFDTDWVAREELISIPFTTKSVDADSFDGSIEFTEIKLSSTKITITATAPFIVFTNFEFNNMYLSVLETGEACDGYLPVTVKPMKLSTMKVYPDQNYFELYPEPEYTDALNYNTADDYPDGVTEEEWIEVDTSSLINGKQYYIGGMARTDHSSKIFIDDTTIIWNDGCTVQVSSDFTLTFENGRFKSNSPMLMIAIYMYFLEPIDGWNKIEVQAASLQSKTITPSDSIQRVVADSGYYGLSRVTINAISSTYVGSAIPMRSAADLIVAGKVVQTPSGYYSSTVGTIVSSAVLISNVLDTELHIGGTNYILASSTGRIRLRYPGSIVNRSIVDKNGEGYITSSMIAEGKIRVTGDFFQLPTLSAQTITPGSTIQYISSYQWLTGSQIIESVPSAELYSLYKAITMKKRIFAEGSTADGYTADDVSSFFQNNLGNFSACALAGIKLSGNFTSPSGGAIPDAFLYLPSINENISYTYTYNAPTVITIGAYAFANNIRLTFISAPSCYNILTGAFINCSYLESVNLSGLANGIGYEAFKSCYRLTSFVSPQIKYIYSSAFAYCSKLSFIDISACRSIYSSAFYNCVSLESIVATNCLEVHAGAFCGCSRLSQANLESCELISSAAFMRCIALEEISIPNCHSIGSEAFYGCTNLSSINIPACTQLFKNAFCRCTSLQGVIDIPLCEKIGDGAFSSCSSITGVKLSACSSIGTYAFANCTILSMVDLTGVSSVPKLGSYAFWWTSIHSKQGSIYVPVSLYESFISASNWSTYSSLMISVN